MLLPSSSPSSSPSSHDECDEVLFGGGSDHLQDIALNPELNTDRLVAVVVVVGGTQRKYIVISSARCKTFSV